MDCIAAATTTMHAPRSLPRPASFVPPVRRLLFACLVTAMGGCASLESASGPETVPQPQPERAVTARDVAITRQAVLPGPPEVVFSFIAAEDVLPKVLTGYGPLPAVVRTSDHTGPWDRPGSARVVHLADGSTVREQITDHDGPRFFAYRVWAFEHPIVRRLATHARGEWTFVPVPGGTHVQWTYTFTARSRWTVLPLSAIAHLLWRGYMDVCLTHAARILGRPEGG